MIVNTCYICGKPAEAYAGVYPLQAVCAEHNPYHDDSQEKQRAELAALRTWRATAEPLLRVMAAMRPKILHMPGAPSAMQTCEVCHMFGLATDPELHTDTCPVTQAKALLAESEASDGN